MACHTADKGLNNEISDQLLNQDLSMHTGACATTGTVPTAPAYQGKCNVQSTCGVNVNEHKSSDRDIGHCSLGDASYD